MRHAHHHGARQEHPFNVGRAAMLDDPARFAYLPPPRVVDLLEAPENAVIVDYGAGTGTYAIEIARALPGARVVAHDNQPEMLALLAAKPAVAELRNLATSSPPALDAWRTRADRVLALNVLHEISLEDLGEIRSLLNAGGFLLVIDWDAAADRPVGPPQDHTYTREEARERLELAGFRCALLGVRFPYHYALRCEAGEESS